MSKKAKLTAIILAIMSSVVGITGCSNGRKMQINV